MNQEIYELFKKYGALLASQPYPLGTEARMILDTDEGVFGTKKGARLGSLKEKDIVKMADKHLSTHRSGMNARIITQTPFCQRCLQEGRSIPAVLDDMAQIIGPEAPVINMTGDPKKASLKMALAIQKSSGLLVQDRIRDGKPAGYTMTVGRSLYEAVVAVTVLEKCAEIYLKSSVIGGAKPLTKREAKKMRAFYQDSYSAAETKLRAAEAPENPAEEAEILPESQLCREDVLRRDLVDYGLRLLETGLVQGTWGNLSARLDEQYMLVTPSGLDYRRLTPSDMVKVDIHSLHHEGSLKPTSEKELHAMIYRSRPEIGAVVHTHSKYCCIFAAAEKDMPVTDLKAREVFGETVKTGGHGQPGSTKLAKNTVKALGENFGCLMAGHGMTACGEDLEAAFAHCRLLESSAQMYIDSRFK